MIDFMERLFPRSQSSLSGAGSGWSAAFSGLFDGARSSSGSIVTANSSLTQATVMACVKVLSETMAQFPRHVYRKKANGTKTIASDHPLSYVLGVRPNQWQTPFEFIEMMQGHLSLRGNGYALIVPGELGSVTELWPLNPDRVGVERMDSGRLRYTVRAISGKEANYTQDEVFHLRGFTLDGLTGLSPIAYARDTIGMNMSAERYGSKLFSNSVRPSGFLKGPAAMRTKDAQDAQRTLMEAYAGEDNAYKPMVLGGALEWQTIGMNNEDAQFIETLSRGDKQIAKIFRMPPHMVGIMDDATFSNIEQQALDFVGHTMLPWVRRWEEAISRDLIADNDEYYLKFEFEGLLRADTAARQSFYTAAINNGWMSPNEVRELEDMPPYKGGDEFFMQGAIVTVDTILNPPEPPAPISNQGQSPEDKAKRDEENEISAKRIGELLGHVDALKADAASRSAALAQRDQECARAEASLAVKESEAAKLADDLQVALDTACGVTSQLAVKSLAAANAEAAATAAQAELDALRAKQAEQEADIAALRLQADRESAAISAAVVENTAMLTTCLSEMLRMESEDIGRASRKAKFIPAAESFYEKHAARMTEALHPLIVQRNALGEPTIAAAALAAQYVESSMASLLTAAECQPEELEQRIAACVSQWKGRPEQIINHLRNTEADNAGT